MKYYYFDTIIKPIEKETRLIFFSNGDGFTQFIDSEDNDGPERRVYLEWVAGNNAPEPFDPENPPI